MCFTATKRTQLKHLAQIRKKAKSQKKGWIWVYKYVKRSAFYSKLVVSTIYSQFRWREGDNISSVMFKPNEINRFVHSGFHAFRSKKAAEKDSYYGVLVKMKCRVKDIFAADSKQIVCTKLYFPKYEYNRILKS